MVALILYPSSVFLNRGKDNETLQLGFFSSRSNEFFSLGNHEDIMVTVRYGFHNEVNQKYRVRSRMTVRSSLIENFRIEKRR